MFGFKTLHCARILLGVGFAARLGFIAPLRHKLRVWLIAVGGFQDGKVRAEFSDIALTGHVQTLRVC